MKNLQNQLSQKQNITEFTINSQWKTITISSYFILRLNKVIELKHKYFENMIEGYLDLSELQNQTQFLCGEIDFLHNEIKEKIDIPDAFFLRKKELEYATRFKQISDDQQNINVLNLRIYSILYSCIINDFDRSLQAEKQIADFLKDDRQKQEDIIDNMSLLYDQSLIILVSMVKNKGKIVNSNLQNLKKFFEYDSLKDLESKGDISEFLPHDMQVIHRLMMKNYMQQGYAKNFVQKVHTYFVNKQGFLKEVYIKIGNLFQESDDYVLTGSLLKISSRTDIILFDQDGKIMGISESLFDIIKCIAQDLTLEQFCTQGYIFNFFPQILSVLRKIQNSVDDIEDIILENLVDYFYIQGNLNTVNDDFLIKNSEQTINTRKSQYSLQSNYRNYDSFLSKEENLNDKQFIQNIIKKVSVSEIQIHDYPIPMLSLKNSLKYLAFIKSQIISFQKQKYMSKRIKIQYSIRFCKMVTKNIKYPYFEMTIETQEVNERIRYQQQHFNQNLKRLLSKIQKNIIQGEDNILTSNQVNQQVSKQNKDFQKALNLVNANEEDKFQNENINVKNQDPYNQIMGFEPENNQQSLMFEKQQQIIQTINDENSDSDKNFQIDVDNYDNLNNEIDLEIPIGSYSTLKQKDQKKNYLDMIQQNKSLKVQNRQSRPSTTRTDISKSPFLIIRSIYSTNNYSGNILWISLLNVIVFLTLLMFMFLQVYAVQQKYYSLQLNLSYLQDPELIHHYFSKSTMLGWIKLEQYLQLVQYSDLINKELNREIDSIINEVENNLMNVYQNIVSNEKMVIQDDWPFYIINDLKLFSLKLEMTVLFQRFIDNTAIALTTLKYITSQEKLQSPVVSSLLFFRVNIMTVNNFCKDFIQFLNDNLQFYQNSIVLTLLSLIMGELLFITMVFLVQMNMWHKINDYIEKILILTTRLTQEEALDVIASLKSVNLILGEPNQTKWKQINYNNIMFGRIQDFKKKKAQQGHPSNQQSQKRNVVQNKRGLKNNSSLTFRIYKLSLPQRTNYIISLLIWVFIVFYFVGALIMTNQQISMLKPSLNLNLQLVEFKLILDSIIVQGEILKTDDLVQQKLREMFDLKNIQFEKNDVNQTIYQYQIRKNFIQSISTIQKKMSDIYDQLISSVSLLDTQKKEFLLIYQDDLCLTIKNMPFCNLDIEVGKSFEGQIKQQFIDEYGSPFSADDNSEYVSGGLINIVQELCKNIYIYFDNEVEMTQTYEINNIQNQANIINFLQTQIHITQFVEFFLYYSQSLTQIINLMHQNNEVYLQEQIVQFNLYIYLSGSIILILLIILQLNRIRITYKKLHLAKFALTLIPYESLLQQKTIIELKKLEKI